MPNIELHGFGKEADPVMVCLWGIIHQIGPSVENDAVVTIVPSTVIDKRIGTPRPYVRVASTKKKDRIRVAMFINERLGLDVEWLHLNGFFEGRKWLGTISATSGDLLRKGK